MTQSADQTARMGGFANLDTQQLCAMCFTSARTVRRWKRTNTMPRLAHFVLELLFYGNLGVIAGEFEGWTLRRGELHAPNGWRFTANDLEAIPLHLQREAALETALLSTAKPSVLLAGRKLATLSHSPRPLPRASCEASEF